MNALPIFLSFIPAKLNWNILYFKPTKLLTHSITRMCWQKLHISRITVSTKNTISDRDDIWMAVVAESMQVEKRVG